MFFYFTGFGGQAPSTSTGRVVCVIYGLVGIPFCLVVIYGLGRQVFKASQRLCIRASCFHHRKWLLLLAHILFGSTLFIWVAAAIFGYIESWAYSDAVYYTFITLSTIGFCDFIPGRCCARYQLDSEWKSRGSLVTRGQFWPLVLSLSVSVFVCVCVSVCVSVNHKLVRTITHHPFKLESPHLDQKHKTPWLRSYCFALDWPWHSRSNLL